MTNDPTPLPLSAHLGFLFQDMPFVQRPMAARAAGFAAAEYPAPQQLGPGEIEAWATSGLPFVQFALRSGEAARGEKGIGIFPERRAEFGESLTEGLNLAERLGVRLVHVMSGRIALADRRPHHLDCYVENLRLAAGAAAARGITLLVEPMSAGAVPDYFVETPDRAAEIIAATGCSNIGLLLDIFHTVATGLDPVAAIARHGELIRHVHIADWPGRHEPGSGSIDWPAVLAALCGAGYQGRFGCEYVPEGATQSGLGWMAGFGRMTQGHEK